MAADVQNISSIVQEVLSTILGQFGGVGNLLSSMLSGSLTNNNSILNDLVWPGTGMSSGQAARSRYAYLEQQRWSSSMRQESEHYQLQAINTLMRQLHPRATDAEIQPYTRNAIDNPFSATGMLYKFTDPYGIAAGNRAAQDLATFMTRSRAGFGLNQFTPEAIKRTRSEIFGEGGLFRDVLDNSGAYGNLAVADVMTLGKELLSSNVSAYTGTDSASRFREDLKKISNAVAPWKDILGNDIPKLLNQLESLTGQSIGANFSSMSSSGYRMASILSQTGANIQVLSGYRDIMASSLGDRTGYNRSILGAHSVAADMILGTANSSVGMLTTQEFQQTAGLFYAGTAKSNFAERYAQAFAAYAAGKTGSMEELSKEFYSAFQGNLGTSATAEAALLAASGVSGGFDILTNYRGTDAYLYAVRSGSGGTATRFASIERAAAAAKSRYLSNFSDEKKAAQEKLLADMNMVDILSMDKSEKMRRFGLSAEDATLLEEAASMGLAAELGMSTTAGQAAGVFKTAMNQRQREQSVQDEMAFRRYYDRTSGTGGLRAVLDKAVLKNELESADPSRRSLAVSTALKAGLKINSGGMAGLLDYTWEDTDESLEMLRNVSGYLMRNAGNMAEGDLYALYQAAVSPADSAAQGEAIKKIYALSKMRYNATDLSAEHQKTLLGELGTSETNLDAKYLALKAEEQMASVGASDVTREWFKGKTALATLTEYKDALDKDKVLNKEDKAQIRSILKNMGVAENPSDAIYKLIEKLDALITALTGAPEAAKTQTPKVGQ